MRRVKKHNLVMSFLLLAAFAVQASPAAALLIWNSGGTDDWATAGNWLDTSTGLPPAAPPAITDVVRIADTSTPWPTIGPGDAATANELAVGRDAAANFCGGTLNITGGSLTMGADMFVLYGKSVTAYVNQTGGTVNLGAKTAISAPVLALCGYYNTTSVYTLNGEDASIIGAQGNRTLAVGKGNSTLESRRCYGTFDHIQGTVEIGTVQVAASYINTTGTRSQMETAVYNLEAAGTLQVDVALEMGADAWDNNEATFNFHGGTLTRDFVGDPSGNTDLRLMKKANTAREIIFQGYGTVDFGPGALTNNGKVIADSLGESDRVLDMSCFASVDNTTESGPSADGWFAANKGKLVLPSIAVASGSGTYNWGESSGDTDIDRVNSLQMDLTNVTGGSAGDMSISLLSADHDDVQAGSSTIGVWAFDDELAFDTAELSVRYDQKAVADSGYTESDFSLFASQNGTDWTKLSSTLDSVAMTLGTTVTGGFDEYYMVAVPEPSTLALLAVGGIIVFSVLRRRQA